jgi:DeoR/GlpR family transcriptional regulator of sugar metabolism
LHVDAKCRIAAAVVELVENGQALILDAGTTGVAIAEKLVEREVTVCTPSFRVAKELLASASVRLMVTGGILRPGEQSFVGPAAVTIFEGYRFDVYLLTVSGIHPEHGLTEWNPEDAAVKRAALRAARRTIVACDSSKIGHTAFARICELGDVELLVTDVGIDREQLGALEALGLKVLVV